MALKLALLALLAAVACAVAARRTRSAPLRRAWLVACGASGVAALYLLLAGALLPTPAAVQVTSLDGTTGAALTVPDDVLGYALRPGARVRATRAVDGVPSYDVVYTVGDDGLRVTPRHPAGAPVILFGCSFTFGEGVADDETLAARLAAALGERADVVNHGVGGYGPHQMLRALETGRVSIPHGARVFHQGLGDHVRRVAGMAPWDGAGPRYVLDGDGVRFVGPMYARPVRMLRRIAHGLARRGLLPEGVFPDAVSDDDRELYVRVVSRAAELVRDAGGRFTVVFWDDSPDASALADRLEARGVEVWRISTLLPGVDVQRLKLPHDEHPSPELYEQLAAAIAERMARETPP